MTLVYLPCPPPRWACTRCIRQCPILCQQRPKPSSSELLSQTPVSEPVLKHCWETPSFSLGRRAAVLAPPNMPCGPQVQAGGGSESLEVRTEELLEVRGLRGTQADSLIPPSDAPSASSTPSADSTTQSQTFPRPQATPQHPPSPPKRCLSYGDTSQLR